jgi:hypothetical protein
MTFVGLFTSDSVGEGESLRSGHHSSTREPHVVIRIAIQRPKCTQTFLIKAQILTVAVDFCREPHRCNQARYDVGDNDDGIR